MVDVRGIRIGNFFKTPDCDNFRVDEIVKMKMGFYCVKNNIGCNGSYLYGVVEDLQPIPLTEELLLKCGFNVECYEFQIKEQLLLTIEDFWILYNTRTNFYVVIFSNKAFKQIEYLHQLQNIYYDFTGKELNIKWNG